MHVVNQYAKSCAQAHFYRLAVLHTLNSLAISVSVSSFRYRPSIKVSSSSFILCLIIMHRQV